VVGERKAAKKAIFTKEQAGVSHGFLSRFLAIAYEIVCSESAECGCSGFRSRSRSVLRLHLRVDEGGEEWVKVRRKGCCPGFLLRVRSLLWLLSSGQQRRVIA